MKLLMRRAVEQVELHALKKRGKMLAIDLVWNQGMHSFFGFSWDLSAKKLVFLEAREEGKWVTWGCTERWV